MNKKEEKAAVIQQIRKHRIIAIIRGVEKEKLISLCEALHKGGIRLVELAFSADGSTSDEETAANIAMLAAHFQGQLYIGAGTVLTKKQVLYTKKAGGQFVISPNTDKAVVKTSSRNGLVSIPGALTPTEAVCAKNYGADFVKLFPAGNLGVDYFKALTAPLSHIDFLAVGGITPDNLSAYLRTNVCGFGISSSLIDKKLIKNNDWPAIQKLAEQYTAVLNHV